MSTCTSNRHLHSAWPFEPLIFQTTFPSQLMETPHFQLLEPSHSSLLASSLLTPNIESISKHPALSSTYTQNLLLSPPVLLPLGQATLFSLWD